MLSFTEKLADRFQLSAFGKEKGKKAVDAFLPFSLLFLPPG